ncbi:MAG: tryptophan--tRNA ligase [Bacilli bacterium]|nr:tryptophan--tRNA ligase [Bacilli bacterium]
MKDIILTGDRPTGKLHLGHYVGSLMNRVKLQNEGNYEKMYVFIADSQALTDNFSNPEKVRSNILEVMLDYLAVGLDPKKVTFFIQSMIPELTEYTFYFMNLVTVNRLMRNPTVKNEVLQKNFGESMPSGFLNYPVSQTADITLFNATVIPAGIDQEPMIEQANEIVRKFNSIYGETLKECKILLPDNEICSRLPGIDGNAKMSKSLGNCIYLSDSMEELHDKVMKMYTDPNHIKITDPGKIEGNIVFTYLDAFCTDNIYFKKYLPDYKNLDELKAHYKRGGLGDVKIKNFLFNILNEILTPIREKREELSRNPEMIYDILKKGTAEAQAVAKENIKLFKQAMKIDYFN